MRGPVLLIPAASVFSLSVSFFCCLRVDLLSFFSFILRLYFVCASLFLLPVCVSHFVSLFPVYFAFPVGSGSQNLNFTTAI